MEKRNYTHVQKLLPEIEAMLSTGKTQREVSDHFGSKDKQVIKELLKRQRRKQRKLAAGIVPRPKGRPRKDAEPRDIAAEQSYEIKRLQMENKLLRDFLDPLEGGEGKRKVPCHLSASDGISRVQDVPVL